MKNKKAVYLLFAANSISGFAQGISMIAIPWYFANMLGKASLFGYIYLGATFVSLFWGLYAGSLIDKFNRKNIFLINSIIGCLILSIISWIGHSGDGLHYAYAGVVFVMTFFIFNIHYPNLYAFAQEISAPKDYGKITSYIEVQGQITTAMAGAMAAILLTGTTAGTARIFGVEVPVNFAIDAWSLEQIFTLNAITYLFAIFFISLIKYESVSERLPDLSPVLTRIVSGLKFLKANPLILVFGLASYTIFITILLNIFYLMPVYINNHLNEGADVYATFEIFTALGSVVAGLAITRIFRRTTTVGAIIIMCGMTCMIYITWIFNTSVPLFFALTALLGLSNAGTRIMRMTYLFNNVPNQIIGRVGSVFNVFSVVMRMFFLFILSSAFFHESNHIVYAILIFAVFVFLGMLVLIIFKFRLENLDRLENGGVKMP